MGALLVNTFLIGIHHAYGVLFIAVREEFGVSYDTACKYGPCYRCKSESKNFGPPKMSESDLDFGRSCNIFSDNF